MEISLYFNEKKELQEHILCFIDGQPQSDKESFEELTSFFKKYTKYLDEKEDLLFVLLTISQIVCNHHRQKDFFARIFKLISYLRTSIQKNLTNEEIFDQFKYSSQILLFTLREKILILDRSIFDQIATQSDSANRRYYHLLYPGIKDFITRGKKKRIEKKLLGINKNILTNFDENIQTGENDEYISRLIRLDLVEDFVTHVSRSNIPLDSNILPSFFESNPFLLNKPVTFIEYATFFGSIQIFQYLKLNGVNLTPSLWLYAIHSNNAEIIHLLEESNVHARYEKVFEESVNCFHNEVAHYLQDNFIKEKSLSYMTYGCRFNNFEFITQDLNLLISLPKSEAGFNMKIPITEVTIPPSLTTIGKFTFKGFTTLKKVTIPPTVTRIFDNAFEGCLSLEEVILPPSMKYIGPCAFNDCLALKITIPSTVVHVGPGAFGGCVALNITCDKIMKKIVYRSSMLKIKKLIISGDVEAIGHHFFQDCNKADYISIPDTVTKIGVGAFQNCSNLKQINIPPLVTIIEKYTFCNCELLKEIKLPSSVVEIGDFAFKCCKILSQINIPDTVTKIGVGAFLGCRSLTQITIPPLVTVINANTFNFCESLREINISSTIVEFGSYAFANCSSLINITIPSTVTKIGQGCFRNCFSLQFGSLTIPPLITIIKEDTFCSCRGLTEVIINSPITKIEKKAFYGCLKLKKINIPPTVTEIGQQAFRKCESLIEIDLPSSVTNIGLSCFRECKSLTKLTLPSLITEISPGILKWCTSLKEITIPSKVTNIPFEAFMHCQQLEKVIITSELLQIDNSAFSDCNSLIEINIPSSVKMIGPRAFQKCESLTGMINLPNVTVINFGTFEDCTKLEQISTPLVNTIDKSAFKNCRSLKQIDLSPDITSIGFSSFCNCSSLQEIMIPNINEIPCFTFGNCESLTKITIPSTAIVIGPNSFTSCQLQEVTIPSSVTTIGKNAFASCKFLKVVDIQSSITEIEEGLFMGCESLTQIQIPSTVTHIKSSAFYQCKSLTNIAIPETVNNIGKHAFDGCLLLQDIKIPESVVSIGDNAFKDCVSIKEITIPNSITTIENNTFVGCKSLVKITIPPAVTSIGICSFMWCTALKEITIPESLTAIQMKTFKHCFSLEKISIPQSVTMIGQKAFADCKSLTRIEIPSSVTQIEKQAFEFCTSLNEIILPSSIKKIDEGCFYNCCSLTKIELPSSITCISKNAFKKCKSLQEITIPSSISTISNSTFYLCDSLTKIDLPNTITKIGNNAFKECISLQEITIPSSVKEICMFAFKLCKSLKKIIIPDSVTSIGKNAFQSCSALEEVTISSSLKTIESFVFSECSKLTSVVIPSSVTAIESRAFEKCTSLGKVTIPSSVKRIGSFCFFQCSSLTNITNSSSLLKIGKCAFKKCTLLKESSIPPTVTKIGRDAFQGCSSLNILKISYYLRQRIKYIKITKRVNVCLIPYQENTEQSENKEEKQKFIVAVKIDPKENNKNRCLAYKFTPVNISLVDIYDFKSYLKGPSPNTNLGFGSHYKSLINFRSIIRGPLNEPILHAINDMGFSGPSNVEATIISFLNQEINESGRQNTRGSIKICGHKNTPGRKKIRVRKNKRQPNYKHDLIVQSPSGTGKTVAFIISMLLHIEPENPSLQTICLSPTRELTLQNFYFFKMMNKYTNFKGRICKNNVGSAQALFGTPKSFQNLVERKSINTSQVKFVVIDEADFIFNIRGPYIEGVKYMMTNIFPSSTQYCFLSSTFNETCITHIKSILPKIETKIVKNKELKLPSVKHWYTKVENMEEAKEAICDIIKDIANRQAIIFTTSSNNEEEINQILQERNIKSEIYSTFDKERREELLNKYRNNEIQVLITSDHLSRGLDIPNIFIVINFGIPSDYLFEKYIHRSGNCSRFGRLGICFNITFNDKQEEYLKMIFNKSNLKENLNYIDIKEIMNQKLISDIHKIEDNEGNTNDNMKTVKYYDEWNKLVYTEEPASDTYPETQNSNLNQLKEYINKYEASDNFDEYLQEDTQSPFHPLRPFDEIIEGNLACPILQILDDLNFFQPSKIESQAISILNDTNYKHDLIAQSPSGTGKTLVFVTSMLLHIDREDHNLQTICLSPTEELSEQSFEFFKKMNEYTKFKVTICKEYDEFLVDEYVQSLFATPTSIRKLIDNETIDFSTIKFVVIDEADFIFCNNGSYNEGMEYMMKNIFPSSTQYCFLSSTFDETCITHIKSILPNILCIRVKNKELKLPSVKHWYTKVENMEEAKEAICDIIKDIANRQAIIFTTSSNNEEEINQILQERNIKSEIYSTFDKERREELLNKYRNNEIQVLITSDHLSRGLDIPNIFIVINFGIPSDYLFEKYIHRSGNCSRFGRLGICFNITFNDKQEEYLKMIFNKSNLKENLNYIDIKEIMNQKLISDIHKIEDNEGNKDNNNPTNNYLKSESNNKFEDILKSPEIQQKTNISKESPKQQQSEAFRTQQFANEAPEERRDIELQISDLLEKIGNYKSKEPNDQNPESIQRLIDEFKIMITLKHPNILKLYGLLVNPKTQLPSILQEQYPFTLEQAIKDKNLSKVQKTYSIYQIAAGMNYIHSRQIVNIDLNPSCIFISEEGIIKISGFGNAQLITDENKSVKINDVYSFGKLVYFILSDGENIPKDFSTKSNHLINACWCRELDKRPTFEVICDILENIKFNLLPLSQEEIQEVSSMIDQYKTLIQNDSK